MNAANQRHNNTTFAQPVDIFSGSNHSDLINTSLVTWNNSHLPSTNSTLTCNILNQFTSTTHTLHLPHAVLYYCHHCSCLHMHIFCFFNFLFKLFGYGWRDGLVVSALDQRPRGRAFESVGCGLSCSNRGPVALCTLGLGLLNPPSSRGQ